MYILHQRTLTSSSNETASIKIGLVSKNSDLEIFKESADVLMGNCFQAASTPEKPLKFKNSLIASAEIERVFSKMSVTLTPQRQKLTFDSLKFHLMIDRNAEDINNDDNIHDCEQNFAPKIILRNFLRKFSLILQQFIAQLSVFLTQKILNPDAHR